MNHIGTKILETDRLILRRFEEKDAEEIFLGFINQEDFLYYCNKEKRSLEDEKQSLIRINEKYKQNNYYNWLITLKDTKNIIGSINLIPNDTNNSVEFNYVIDDRYKNNGYMSEALLTVKDFCLKKLCVKRFQGCCSVKNLPSKRVMEKCNMQYEGTLRKYLKLKDGYHDMHMFSIINLNV